MKFTTNFAVKTINHLPRKTMSRRPIAVEQLINDTKSNGKLVAKPKFLSKSAREKLKKLEQQKHQLSANTTRLMNRKRRALQIDNHSNTEENETHIQNPNLEDKQSKKFKFDWDLSEDTSYNYEPEIDIDISRKNDDIDLEIKNDKHWSEKSRDEMCDRDWRIFKEDFNISSKGGNIGHPLRSWDEAKIPRKLLTSIVSKYENPTPIQRATIPLAIDHRDVVGIAETGSGKTLAFLIPLLAYILSIEENYLHYEHQQEQNFNKPLGLILAPTRELALQIHKEATKFCGEFGLNVVSIIGGHQYEETVHSVSNGVHIVVGTPGRLVDSIDRNIISLDKCYYFIMDEADKMIDMGFEKSVQTIISQLPTSDQLVNSIDLRIFYLKKRITLMFTATISPAIEKITRNYLIQPAYLTIGNSGQAIDNIDQQFEYIGAASIDQDQDAIDSKRVELLIKVIRKHIHQNPHQYSIIIFANFRRVCDLLSSELTSKGYKDNVVIHGSKSQDVREQAIAEFRCHKSNILIATDVAARGIDIPNVSLVINYQMVKKFDEYIHRIGRTGRAGNVGTSYTFLDDTDTDMFMSLKRFLVRGGKTCPKWLSQHKSTTTQLVQD
jgi:ATP-dependent RNA helicase DDX23/PRP28